MTILSMQVTGTEFTDWIIDFRLHDIDETPVTASTVSLFYADKRQSILHFKMSDVIIEKETGEERLLFTGDGHRDVFSTDLGLTAIRYLDSSKGTWHLGGLKEA